MINLTIHTQPDDESCGPTSLHAIYNYYGLKISLRRVMSNVAKSRSGGTLASMLGQDALRHGFITELYANSVKIFDPTWFAESGAGIKEHLIDKLEQQMQIKQSISLQQESKAYIEYLLLGGHINFKTINVQLLKEYFVQKIPIIAGLSATYLYRSPREIYTEHGESMYDDIRGTPSGHFVVLCGYDDQHRLIVVADPHRANPISHDNYYKVSSNRLINAIMLGVLTYDADLLMIKPRC